MKIVGKSILEEFGRKHADSRKQIGAWYRETEESTWQSPSDIKARYASASFLANNLVVFNLKGNKYRLVVQVSFKHQVVVIKKIGTHAEYSLWQF